MNWFFSAFRILRRESGRNCATAPAASAAAILDPVHNPETAGTRTPGAATSALSGSYAGSLDDTGIGNGKTSQCGFPYVASYHGIFDRRNLFSTAYSVWNADGTFLGENLHIFIRRILHITALGKHSGKMMRRVPFPAAAYHNGLPSRR